MKKVVVAIVFLLVLPTCSSGSSHPDGGDAGGSAAGTSGAGTGGRGSGGTGTGGVGAGGKGGAAQGTGGASIGGTGGGLPGTGGAGGHGVTGGGGASGGKGATGGKGGSASGGRGGSGIAGHVGTGGATGGQGGGPVAQAECATASDCKLQSDCCVCAAVPVSAPGQPTCGLTCIQSRCAALQLPSNSVVACVAGRCVAGFSCDASHILCSTGPPTCVQGQVPGLTSDGVCYTGSCVDASQCESVTSCASCNANNEACVTDDAQTGPQHHCVSIPTACGGDASCACLGPTTCVGSYRSCSSSSGSAGVSCSCPTC